MVQKYGDIINYVPVMMRGGINTDTTKASFQSARYATRRLRMMVVIALMTVLRAVPVA